MSRAQLDRCSARRARARARRRQRLVEDFGLAYIATGDMLRAAVREGTELGRAGQGVHERRRARPRRRSMIGDDRASASPRRTPRTASSSTASRATSPRPRRLNAMLDELGRRLTAALLHRRPRRGGRAAALGPARVRQERPHLPRRVRPAQARGRLRPGRRAARCSATTTSPRRSVSTASSVYHEQTRAARSSTTSERGLLRRFDGTRGPTEVHDHIRATLATLRLEERLL